jgi:dihydrofolate reductase
MEHITQNTNNGELFLYANSPENREPIKNHFSMIAAMAKGTRGIGKDGKLPWKNKTDMKYFKNITTQRLNENKFNAVIMGRRTFESLGGKLLPNRINICITRKKEIEDKYDCLTFSSLDEALFFLYGCPEIESIFVIGGEMLFKEAIEHKDCRELLINEIDCRGLPDDDVSAGSPKLAQMRSHCANEEECDTFFPEINSDKYLLVHTAYLGENVTNTVYRAKDSYPL